MLGLEDKMIEHQLRERIQQKARQEKKVIKVEGKGESE
jgi:hypothetical protein